jgi:cytochrome P450
VIHQNSCLNVFLHEDKDHHPFAFVPFGGGHRACAGQELAWLELKTIVVRMMQRVTFEDTGMKDNSGGYDQQMLCYPRHLAIHVRVDNE